MGKDGVNISEAPADFKRPELPPLPCRCGRTAEEVLDGSLWGCSVCCISGSSVAEWNRMVRGDVGGPAFKPEWPKFLLESAERYLQFRHDSDVGFGTEYSGEHPETQLKRAIALAKGGLSRC